ncbi:hypothetical protein [Photobacterium kagoshimensis]|uniref:hypothetical protein n=1 Tax=Photobacterium kagoshimensis TaxID=2910242 RepID=UPI003D12DAEA
MKEYILCNLADLTEVLHLALEGNDVDASHREIYLGHLAMCARLFKIIQLNQGNQEFNRILNLEARVYRLATPNDDRGKIVKEAWEQVFPILHMYNEIST